MRNERNALTKKKKKRKNAVSSRKYEKFVIKYPPILNQIQCRWLGNMVMKRSVEKEIEFSNFRTSAKTNADS